MKLYEVCKEMEAMIRMDDDFQDTICYFETMGLLSMEKEKLAKNIAWGIKNTQAEVDAYEKEADRIKDILRVKKNKVDGMSDYLNSFLTKEETEKFTNDPTIDFKWRKSSAVNLKVSPEDLPDAYVRIEEKRYPDKPLIKKHIQGGVVSLLQYAEIEERQNLTIK